MPAITSFTGEHPQKVDGKGRMSIPADFRRVLEAGDPDWSSDSPPALYVVYGDHLRDKLQAYTVAAFNEMVEAIRAMRPKSREEAERKAMTTRLILGQSIRLEVDRDGRVVLPIAQRRKIGLTEGNVVFSGAGDHFEIWAGDTFDAKVGAPMQEFLAEQGEFYDPMVDVWSAVGS